MVCRNSWSIVRLFFVAVASTMLLILPTSVASGAPLGPSEALSANPAWQGWVSSGGSKLVSIPGTTAARTEWVVADPADVKPQKWLGVGASLTDASVSLLKDRPTALSVLYSPTDPEGAHLNLLRLPLTSTDMSSTPWWLTMTGKSKLVPTTQFLAAVQLTNQAKSIQPLLSVMAAPWSAPPSMKSPQSLQGGLFNGTSKNIASYADLVSAEAQWLLAQGVPLKFMTLANEPNYSVLDYPTMEMTNTQLLAVAKSLGTRLSSRGVQLWALDHNWEDAVPREEADAKTLTASAGLFQGVAFHCYRGSPGQMMQVPAIANGALPAAITECTGTTDSTQGTFEWDSKNLVVDAINSGSRALFMWNLALDPTGGPKIPGTCGGPCRGVITIDPSSSAVTEQPEFYTLAQLSRAADPGAQVLGTTSSGGVIAVSFKNLDGIVGVYGYNLNADARIVSVEVKGAGERRFSIEGKAIFTLRGLPGTPIAAPKGSVAVGVDDTRWYIDTTGYRHRITTEAIYACNVTQAPLVTGVSLSELTKYPLGEDAACKTFRSGDIIKHPDGDSYVLDADALGRLQRHWIPTVTDFVCARAEQNRQVITVTRYMVTELTSGANRAGGNCIVRAPAGDSHFINNQGLREWIPDSPTWDCEVGRGVRVINVVNGFTATVGETGWHYCLNKANIVNKVLRHSDGDAYFIHPDATKTWIPDGATFSCRTRAGYPVVDTRWREYVNAFPGSQWDYCYNIETLKGRIISHPDGDSHYVDWSGFRHWIPNTTVYWCLRNKGVPADTVRWRDYINRTPEGAWATCS